MEHFAHVQVSSLCWRERRPVSTSTALHQRQCTESHHMPQVGSHLASCCELRTRLCLLGSQPSQSWFMYSYLMIIELRLENFIGLKLARNLRPWAKVVVKRLGPISFLVEADLCKSASQWGQTLFIVRLNLIKLWKITPCFHEQCNYFHIIQPICLLVKIH